MSQCTIVLTTGYVHQSTMVYTLVLIMGYVNLTIYKLWFSRGYIYTNESGYNCCNDGLRTLVYTRLYTGFKHGLCKLIVYKLLFSLGYIYTNESGYNCFNDGLRTSVYTGLYTGFKRGLCKLSSL